MDAQATAKEEVYKDDFDTDTEEERLQDSNREKSNNTKLYDWDSPEAA